MGRVMFTEDSDIHSLYKKHLKALKETPEVEHAKVQAEMEGVAEQKRLLMIGRTDEDVTLPKPELETVVPKKTTSRRKKTVNENIESAPELEIHEEPTEVELMVEEPELKRRVKKVD